MSFIVITSVVKLPYIGIPRIWSPAGEILSFRDMEKSLPECPAGMVIINLTQATV